MMTCGLCKRPIRGDENYVIDHYTCSAELQQSLITERDEALEALKLVALNFQRNDASGNFLGDDDHEAWSAVNRVIEKAEGK